MARYKLFTYLPVVNNIHCLLCWWHPVVWCQN